jgi:hypothetical protein
MYTVGANGICQSTAAEQSGYVTITKIQAWNPNLNALCTNMKQQDGTQISVRYVGETKPYSGSTDHVETSPGASFTLDLLGGLNFRKRMSVPL